MQISLSSDFDFILTGVFANILVMMILPKLRPQSSTIKIMLALAISDCLLLMAGQVRERQREIERKIVPMVDVIPIMVAAFPGQVMEGIRKDGPLCAK